MRSPAPVSPSTTPATISVIEIMAKADTKKKPASSATRAESVRAFQAARTPEERSESARKAQAARTPEQRAAIAAKAAATRAANAAKKKARQEAAAKGVATKRERYPDKFKAPIPPKSGGKGDKKRGKKGSSAQKVKDPRRVAAGLKSAATRKRNEAARIEAARQMREGIEGRKREEGADWRSELTYMSGPGIGSLGEWVRELFRAIVEDTDRIYQPGKNPDSIPPGLLEIPWRVQGGAEGAAKGAASFDLVVEGTSHERVTAILAALVAAGERGGVIGGGYNPAIIERMTARAPRSARPQDAAAERAKAEAVAKYTENADKERQVMRIQTLVAPVYSATWRGQAIDDDEPVPF